MSTSHRHPLSYYMKDTGESYIFTGKKCKVYIPKRYEIHNLLHVDEQLSTLAIFEIEIDEEPNTYGYNFPAVMKMQPSTTYNQQIDGKDYLVAEFYTNDVFFASKQYIQQGFIANIIFNEFIVAGNLPRFMNYETLAMLFNTAQSVCNINLKVPHAIFEMMYAHLARDSENLNTKYRHTDMKKNPAFIGLRNIAYSTDSTTTKIIGSYMSDGINSAIINKSEQQYELEDLLRV